MRYPISYRQLAEMISERGISVDYTTIYRWIQHYAPEFEKSTLVCQAFSLEELMGLTLKLEGNGNIYTELLINMGKTIDFFLSQKRDAESSPNITNFNLLLDLPFYNCDIKLKFHIIFGDVLMKIKFIMVNPIVSILSGKLGIIKGKIWRYRGVLIILLTLTPFSLNAMEIEEKPYTYKRKPTSMTRSKTCNSLSHDSCASSCSSLERISSNSPFCEYEGLKAPDKVFLVSPSLPPQFVSQASTQEMAGKKRQLLSFNLSPIDYNSKISLTEEHALQEIFLELEGRPTYFSRIKNHMVEYKEIYSLNGAHKIKELLDALKPLYVQNSLILRGQDYLFEYLRKLEKNLNLQNDCLFPQILQDNLKTFFEEKKDETHEYRSTPELQLLALDLVLRDLSSYPTSIFNSLTKYNNCSKTENYSSVCIDSTLENCKTMSDFAKNYTSLLVKIRKERKSFVEITDELWASWIQTQANYTLPAYEDLENKVRKLPYRTSDRFSSFSSPRINTISSSAQPSVEKAKQRRPASPRAAAVLTLKKYSPRSPRKSKEGNLSPSQKGIYSKPH